MIIAQIMTTEVVTLGPDDSLDTAMALFEKHGVRHIPVVQKGSLVSLLSSRELSLATGWRSALDRKASGRGGPTLVREIVRDRVVTLTPDQRVEAAASMMVGKRVGAIPILEGTRLVGLVTTRDLLSAFRTRNPAAEWGVDEGVTVSDYMSSKVETLAPEQDVAEAAGICLQKRVRHLPITEGGDIVGLIKDNDVWLDPESQPGDNGSHRAAPLSRIMNTEPVTIGPDAALTSAADSMLEHKVGALPVVKDQALVGLLTDEDIIQHCTSRRRLPPV